MSGGPALAPDAAMVLGIASTAMPFACDREAEAERWLRLLRLHGEVGIALQALGVSEMAMPLPGDEPEGERHERGGQHEAGDQHEAGERHEGERHEAGRGSDVDPVEAVTEHTVRIARERGAHGVATTDVLMAVMHVYGEEFDRVLRSHGTDREELLERLGSLDVEPARFPRDA
jgi:hypothetical protein